MGRWTFPSGQWYDWRPFTPEVCVNIFCIKYFWDSPIFNTTVHTDHVISQEEFAAFIKRSDQSVTCVQPYVYWVSAHLSHFSLWETIKPGNIIWGFGWRADKEKKRECNTGKCKKAAARKKIPLWLEGRLICLKSLNTTMSLFWSLCQKGQQKAQITCQLFT